MGNKKKIRIAVFGGTFDPPHVGHFRLAEQVLEHDFADRVMFVPALSPPHKPGIPRSVFEDRVAMVQLGIDKIGEERFFINDLEGNRQGTPSYTFDTMIELSEAYPDKDLLLLLGADSLWTLHSWYRAEEIVTGWEVLTYPRHGFNFISELTEFWPEGIASRLAETILPFEICNVSSTEIREKIQHDADVSDLVFSEIIEYIKKRGLYKRD